MFEEHCQSATIDRQVEIVLQYIIIGKEVAAMQVKDISFLNEWYCVSGASLHVTLLRL